MEDGNTTPNAPTSLLPLRARDISLYSLCDILSGGLIYAMVLFSPWAFGTTQPWSIRAMNTAGFLLGLLLAAKLLIRWLKGYRPPRWDADAPPHRSRSRPGWRLTARQISAGVALLTLGIVGYCLVSALNARSTCYPDDPRVEYHPCLSWLPHSYDSTRSWLHFWIYLALAASFWAIRDWLPGKTAAEERSQPSQAVKTCPLAPAPQSPFPARLRSLLWLLAINGALLALEGIIQRLEGSGNLLFLVKPAVNKGAEAQFGPFAYRANASAYFNLLWPVCLGFWWTLNRAAEASQRRHHLLLAGAALMAACPIISTSRGGALVSVAMLGLATLFLAGSAWLAAARAHAGRKGADSHGRRRRHGKSHRPGAGQIQILAGPPPGGQARASAPAKPAASLRPLLLFLAGAPALGLWLGWHALQPRMAELGDGFQGREQMNAFARPMVADALLFGTGPGTFRNLYQFYRISPDTYWPAQLHNDWLESLITFGVAGCVLIALAFGGVLLRWFAPGGIHGGRRFVGLIWLALAGCLVHARWDFPFQIYSILFLWLTLCAVLFSLTRRAC